MDSGAICWGVILIVIACAACYAAFIQNIATKAKAEYAAALNRLKRNPHNADLREETLRLGRVYVELARKATHTGGRNLFDEVMLSNDIAAACAGAGNPRDIEIPTAQLVQPNLEERLERLDSLLKAKRITATEHASRRAKILDEI